MSTLSTSTTLTEDLLELTKKVFETFQSHSDYVTNTPGQNSSITDSLSNLHKVLSQLIEAPSFELSTAAQSNFDQTSVFFMTVCLCAHELNNLLRVWSEMIKGNRFLRDDQYWSSVDRMIQRGTANLRVCAQAFQSCLTIDGRYV